MLLKKKDIIRVATTNARQQNVYFQNELIKLPLSLKIEKRSDHIKNDKLDIARVRLEYTKRKHMYLTYYIGNLQYHKETYR